MYRGIIRRNVFLLALPLLAISFPISVAMQQDDLPGNGIQPASPVVLTTDLADYIWPTNGGRKMTSSFAEFRRTHFHGGVDVGTGSTTGFEVYAMRDGYVAKINVSPTGYGKMLYVRHPDGFYTTYAHLAHFNAELDARVAREQRQNECFPVEIECPPGEFPVRKGDLIAYTGETGVGTPHLHFEIRDAQLDFVNPLAGMNLAINDDIRPTIRRIAITPIGEQSAVQGRWNSHVYGLHRTRGGDYKVAETIQLTGEGGFAIDARDVSNGSGFRHGVYSHQLFIDDSLLYSVRLDRAPAKDAHQIALYYDWKLMGRGRLERLYVNSPNTLGFYSPKGGRSGILNSSAFAEGPHEFRIVTSDFAGNSSTVYGTIVLNHPPAFTLEPASKEFQLNFQDMGSVQRVMLYFKKNSASDWNLKTIYPDPSNSSKSISLPAPEGKYDVLKVVAENTWGTRSRPVFHFFQKPNGPAGGMKIDHEFEEDFVRIIARTGREFTEPPTVSIYEGDSKRTITLTALDIDHYVGSFRPLESYQGTRRLVAQAEVNGKPATTNDEFDLYPIIAGTSGTISFDNGKLVLKYEPSSVFKTVFMRIEKNTQGGYSLVPENAVLNTGLIASMRVERPSRTQGLFFNGFGSEELLDVAGDPPKSILTGRITRTLGELYLDEDHSSPGISRLNISRTSGGKPLISFRYGDSGSGVDYKELKMYIDGVIAVPEIDGEHHRAFHNVTSPLDRGSHHLTIRIKDRLGNSSEVERKFTVR